MGGVTAGAVLGKLDGVRRMALNLDKGKEGV
jgi:hypothetical protein